MFDNDVLLNKIDKKIYKKGSNLKILEVTFPFEKLIQFCMIEFNEAMYLYTFKVIYEDSNGDEHEIYSQPYAMPELNYILNFFSSQGEVEQVLRMLKFEVKEYEGQIRVYISATKENIKKFKEYRNTYEERKRNLIIENKVSTNEELNNYIIDYLNSFFEKKNIKISLNQNDFVENKVKYELFTGYNYNLREMYSTEDIKKSIGNNEFGASHMLYLLDRLSIDVKENKEIAIHISNYSEECKMEGMTINVYCQIN